MKIAIEPLCCFCAASVLLLCCFCAASFGLCCFFSGCARSFLALCWFLGSCRARASVDRGRRPVGAWSGAPGGSPFIRKHSVFVWEVTAAWDRSGPGQRLQTAVISYENTVFLYGSDTNFWGGSKFLVEMLYFSEVRFFHANITTN